MTLQLVARFCAPDSPIVLLPRPLEQAIAEFSKLPGVGRRSAERMALALLAAGAERSLAMADSLRSLAANVGLCPECGYFTDTGQCPLCTNPGRDNSVLCIVESPTDVIAFERAGGFPGRYHVLGGVLSPLKGVAPEDLRFEELRSRVSRGSFEELILATSPSVEGDATALYVSQMFRGSSIRLTRIGRGVPVGSSLDLTDAGTLRLSIEGRRQLIT